MNIKAAISWTEKYLSVLCGGCIPTL